MVNKMKKGWIEWKGKKIFVVLENGRNYSGEVIEIFTQKEISGEEFTFMKILDKFKNYVCFKVSEIKLIEEEKSESRKRSNKDF